MHVRSAQLAESSYLGNIGPKLFLLAMVQGTTRRKVSYMLYHVPLHLGGGGGHGPLISNFGGAVAPLAPLLRRP